MQCFETERRKMVLDQIAGRGISNPAVLSALGQVGRDIFVRDQDKEKAYEDKPLAIGHAQTISQPYIVALMCEALAPDPGCKALDVGTGSGYAAAVLSHLCARVVSIERIDDLARRAKENLHAANCQNVEIVCGDGSLGYPNEAPYDVIAVAASAPAAPEALQRQLRIGGRLVIPVGQSSGCQSLIRVTRVSNDRFETKNLGAVAFVPLIGKEAWPEQGCLR